MEKANNAEGVAAPLEPSQPNVKRFWPYDLIRDVHEPTLIRLIADDCTPKQAADGLRAVADWLVQEVRSEPPKSLTAEQFYSQKLAPDSEINEFMSYVIDSHGVRCRIFDFAEAYAAAVSKNLQEERRPWIDAINRELAGLRGLWNSAERKLKTAESRILELEKEITALRETK